MKKGKHLIPLSKVCIDQEIKGSVCKVLESGQYILGKECKAFEQEFACFIGTRFAVLTGSGTAAIWLALIALGVKQGDEIIVPSLTAFPTVEPILMVGAKPVFVDIDDTYTISPDQILKVITRKTVGIIPVHLYGHPANIMQIIKIARSNKLFVLEDCCQSHGARFNGKRVGSFGIAGCFSFYPSKNLTVCGDGGVVTTNDRKLYNSLRMLRDHGRSTKYLHSVLGYNERFNEIQAAIGRILLRRLDDFNKKRRRIAELYKKKLSGLPLFLPDEAESAYHVYHMFVMRTQKRDSLMSFLAKENIGAGIHYPIPCHLQPPILRMQERIKLPLTEQWCKEIISLPIYPSLLGLEINYISERIKGFFD